MKVDVIVGKPKVAYKETITRKAETSAASSRSRSGGRGQFGDCTIHIEPFTAAQAEAEELDFDR